ncbi:MAG: hypothetical protein QOH57_131 [Mycobacterium sp.]|jgi:hypothetical protein|nr:hypothetical protein [Mycobacterium sp.]
MPLVAGVALAAAFFSVGGDAQSRGTGVDARAAAVEPEAGHVELVALPPIVSRMSTASSAPVQLASKSKAETVLPVGIAPESGLQVKTILASRTISAVFPEIHEIGGVRPDALRWHPDGLALDVMIPSPGTAEGIALGNQIVGFALNNADRLGLQDVIWRGVYYTPGGAQSGNYGHFDHVHITTIGGGYPAGDEKYLF